MMNRELILGRKREFDSVLYKLWPLQAPWSSSVKSTYCTGMCQSGRWLA